MRPPAKTPMRRRNSSSTGPSLVAHIPKGSRSAATAILPWRRPFATTFGQMTLRAHARFSEDRRDGTTKEIIKIPFPIREWIIELDKLDPRGTAFRYADDEAGTLRYAEYWVDFVHFKYRDEVRF